MDYCLYKKESYIVDPTNASGYEILKFNPTIRRLFLECEENRDAHTIFFRVYISLLTKNKTRIYLALNSKRKVIHTAYVIPHNFKYPFLGANEFAIGPCCTEESFRGNGVYPMVLNYITNTNEDQLFYMFIRKENKASIRGVEKAGFKRCDCNIKGTRFLNRFIKIDN